MSDDPDDRQGDDHPDQARIDLEAGDDRAADRRPFGGSRPMACSTLLAAVMSPLLIGSENALRRGGTANAGRVQPGYRIASNRRRNLA